MTILQGCLIQAVKGRFLWDYTAPKRREERGLKSTEEFKKSKHLLRVSYFQGEVCLSFPNPVCESLTPHTPCECHYSGYPLPQSSLFKVAFCSIVTRCWRSKDTWHTGCKSCAFIDKCLMNTYIREYVER